MFLMINTADIASYADDNTPYSVGKNQCKLEKKSYKMHQANILNDFMKMS